MLFYLNGIVELSYDIHVFLLFFFSEFYDRVDGDLSMSFGGLHGRGSKKQDPPIERDLYLSLEEVFHGCTKKMKISRRVIKLCHMSRVKRICVFEHSVMTHFNCACPAIQRGQGSGFLSEGSSWLTACTSEQRRFWRDCADAQARLNLRCSHRR